MRWIVLILLLPLGAQFTHGQVPSVEEETKQFQTRFMTLFPGSLVKPRGTTSFEMELPLGSKSVLKTLAAEGYTAFRYHHGHYDGSIPTKTGRRVHISYGPDLRTPAKARIEAIGAIKRVVVDPAIYGFKITLSVKSAESTP